MPNEDNLTAREIINIIESVAPLSQQEGWDNSGLQIGRRETEVAQVLLCTDVTDDIVEEAVRKDCQMIISHHPLLFHGLKRIEGLTREERCAIKAIQQGIVIYSSHTAMDTCLHGVSGRMAEKLGMTDYKILSPSGAESGLGVIGYLQDSLSLQEFLQLLKQTFLCPCIRYSERLSKENMIHKVALCGGAGSEFMEDAIADKADAYVTADIKYHEMQAADGRINLFDIGHFESEQFTKEIFKELLEGYDVKCVIAEEDKSCVKVY